MASRAGEAIVTSDARSSIPPVVCKASVLDERKFNRPIIELQRFDQS